MRTLKVFCKKELVEVLRSKKFYILAGVLLLLSMLSALSARYMNEIVSLAMKGQDIPIEIPVSTWREGWSEYYSNILQMGAICIIVMFMGTVCGEKRSGTAVLTLTKLPVRDFILGKFIVIASAVATAFLISISVCYGYIYVLFGEAGNLKNVAFSVFMYIIFMLLFLSICICASTLAKNSGISALITFAALFVISLLGFIPKVGKILPSVLSGQLPTAAVGMVQNNAQAMQEIWIAIGISVVLIVGFLWTAIFSLKRQEL